MALPLPLLGRFGVKPAHAPGAPADTKRPACHRTFPQQRRAEPGASIVVGVTAGGRVRLTRPLASRSGRPALSSIHANSGRRTPVGAGAILTRRGRRALD